MTRLFRQLLYAVGALLGLVGLAVAVLWIRYGGGAEFEDRPSEPSLPAPVVVPYADGVGASAAAGSEHRS